MSTKIASDRKMRVEEILAAFGMKAGGTVTGVAYGGAFHDDASGPLVETRDPSTGDILAHVRTARPDDCRRAVTEAHEAFSLWRQVPAPHRGEIVRRLGDGFRARKEELARLISLENGKILSEPAARSRRSSISATWPSANPGNCSAERSRLKDAITGWWSSGIRLAWSGSYPRSTFRSRSRAGAGRWPSSAGTLSSGSRRA